MDASFLINFQFLPLDCSPMPTIALPVPNPDEVEQFRALYARTFGVELSENEAWEAATRTLRLFCLATYGLPDTSSPLTEPSWPTSSTPAKAKKTIRGKSNPSATNSNWPAN
jgi:hypothetical protein